MFHQLFMCADFYYLPLVHYYDLVSMANCTESMRNDHNSAVCESLAKGAAVMRASLTGVERHWLLHLRIASEDCGKEREL